MKSIANRGGGDTIILNAGDSLDDVPVSHSDIVTSELRAAFIDPPAYFNRIASHSQLASFGAYLNHLASEGRWSLVLADTYMMERRTIGAFQWSHPCIRGAMIAPKSSLLGNSQFDTLYRDVAFVHWEQVGFAGGILPPDEHVSMQDYGISSSHPQFDAVTSFVFANSDCGDVMVYSRDGTAGFVSHEDGKAYVIGSVCDSMEFIFTELLYNRAPQFDYTRS